MKKLLFFYVNASTFVDQDLRHLSDKFRVLQRDFPSYKHKWLTPWYFIQNLFHLLFHLRGTHAILCSFAGYHTILPVIFGKWSRIPVYIVLNGAECAKIPSVRYGNLKKRLLAWATRFSLRHATKLLPVSGFLLESEIPFADPSERKQGIRHFMPGLQTPARVIHNGFDPGFWQRTDGVHRDPRLVLAVASASQYLRKGIPWVEAAAELLPDFRFEIIALRGPGFERSKVANVRYLGELNGEEMRRKFSEATIYLQCSFWEGFGCALCESMLCEMVPLVADVNILPEMVAGIGFTVTERTPEALAATIQEVAEREDLAERGKAARKRIENDFHISRRMAAIFEELGV